MPITRNPTLDTIPTSTSYPPFDNSAAEAARQTQAALQDVFNTILPNSEGGNPGTGTSIPYMFNFFGTFISNPSTVSIDTLRRIATTDPAIQAALTYESSLVVGTIGEYHHDNPRIKKLVQQNNRYLENQGGFKGFLKDINSERWAGNYNGEIEETQDQGWYRIKSVTPLPPTTIVYTVDAQGKRNGTFQYIINSPTTGYQSFNISAGGYGGYGIGNTGTFTGVDTAPLVDPFADAGDFPYPIRQPFVNLFGLNPLDDDLIIHFTSTNSFALGNPYNYSVLRSIYSLYVMKYGVLQFLSQVLYRKSTPLLVIYYDGTLNTQNPDSPLQTQPLADSIMAAAYDIGGNGILPIPTMTGAKAEAIKIDGNLQPFIETLYYIDKSMFMGLIMPQSLSNSTHMGGSSHSSTYMQDSIHSKLIADRRDDITSCVLNTYVKKLIENNFIYGKDYTDFGYFKEEALSLDEKLKYQKLFEGMINSGIGSNKNVYDIERMRNILGEDAPDEMIKELVEQNKQILQQTSKVNQRDTLDAVEKPFAHWE